MSHSCTVTVTKILSNQIADILSRNWNEDLGHFVLTASDFFFSCLHSVVIFVVMNWWKTLRCGRLKPKSSCRVQNPLLLWDFLTHFGPNVHACFLFLTNPHSITRYFPYPRADDTSCEGLVNAQPTLQIGNFIQIITTLASDVM